MGNKKSDIEKFIEKEFPGQEYHKLDIPPQPASQEAPVTPTPPKKLDNLSLLELVCQLHSRALTYQTKEMHDAYVEARKEMESRLSQPVSVQVEGQEKDAVGFAEWVNNKYWYQRDEKLWYSFKEDSKDASISSQDLYTLYLNRDKK